MPEMLIHPSSFLLSLEPENSTTFGLMNKPSRSKKVPEPQFNWRYFELTDTTTTLIAAWPSGSMAISIRSCTSCLWGAKTKLFNPNNSMHDTFLWQNCDQINTSVQSAYTFFNNFWSIEWLKTRYWYNLPIFKNEDNYRQQCRNLYYGN